MKNETIKNTVLVSAYAVNPFHGSEDGMGWNFINQIARFNKVIAVTRENTRADIERYMNENPARHYQNIQFVYFDLPYWMRFWKRGGRGALLYYYLWQNALPGFVRKEKLKFDIVHNLNFHNDWTPSMLWKLHKPFVWGPIGHHSRIPKDYVLHVYGRKQYIMEQIKWWVKKYFWRMDPFLQQTINHADTVLTMNSSVAKVLTLRREKTVHMTSVSSEAPRIHSLQNKEKGFTVLSAGRFVPLKGFDITIKSFARFYHRLTPADRAVTKLILVGDGPYKNYLQRLTNELELNSAVEFVDWLERDEYKKLLERSHAFLFPSHEGAGMVVAEALSYGLPVLCFSNDGPGEFIDDTCGLTVPYSRYDTSITRFADGLQKLQNNKVLYQQLSQGAIRAFESKFDWNLKGEILRDVYDSITRNAS